MNEEPMIEFTALCRCDRCGAQAYTAATSDEFGMLFFCLHHRKQHVDALMNEGWTIVDDYEAIERLAPDTFVKV